MPEKTAAAPPIRPMRRRPAGRSRCWRPGRC